MVAGVDAAPAPTGRRRPSWYVWQINIDIYVYTCIVCACVSVIFLAFQFATPSFPLEDLWARLYSLRSPCREKPRTPESLRRYVHSFIPALKRTVLVSASFAHVSTFLCSPTEFEHPFNLPTPSDTDTSASSNGCPAPGVFVCWCVRVSVYLSVRLCFPYPARLTPSLHMLIDLSTPSDTERSDTSSDSGGPGVFVCSCVRVSVRLCFPHPDRLTPPSPYADRDVGVQRAAGERC